MSPMISPPCVRRRVQQTVFFVVALTAAASCSLLDRDDTTNDAAPASSAATATSAPTSTTTTSAPTTESTTVPSFADSFAVVSTGVYRVDAVYCDGITSTGSGFLVSPTLLLTAAHVTGDATTVDISRDDTAPVTATVVATDEARDLALVALPQSAPGHVFLLDDSAIRVGDEVAALGHPQGLPLTFTSGRVSALAFNERGVSFHQTDAPVNPGNSGGPLIDSAGNVVGMTDWKFTDLEGISFVVAATEIQEFLDSDQLVIDIELGCDAERPTPTDPVIAFDDPVLAEIPLLFDQYVMLINAASEGEAYDLFAGPRLRSIISREAFIEGNSTSILEDLRVYNAFYSTDARDSAEAWVTFVSYQDPEFGTDGQACSVWDLTYELILESDRWKIQRAVNEPGSPSPC